MDKEQARQQLIDIEERRAAADDAAVSSTPTGTLSFLAVLFVFVAASDLPEPWTWVVQVVAAVAIVGYMIRYMTRKKAAIEKSRYQKAVGWPLATFYVGAITFVIVVSALVRGFDLPYPSTIIGAVYVVGIYLGMKIYDRVVKDRLTKRP